MRKKLVSMLLVIAVGLGMFSGCSNATSKSNPNEIVIWHDKEDVVAQVLQEELSVLEPELTIKLVRKDGLTDALKLVGNDPASAPDMYIFAYDKIGVYAEIGILAPITDFVSEEKLGEYVPVTVEAATYNDTVYQLPLYYESLLYMYNKDLMKEEDVPKTTEDLYIYMQKYTKQGHYGFVEQHSTAYYSTPWIQGYGGQLITEDGKPNLTSDELKAALNYHKKFVSLMPGESEYNTVNTLFLEGMADSIIGGPWLVPSARDAGIELGFAPMPTINSLKSPLTPYMGVQGVHVLKVAQNNKKEAVAKVLDVLSKPEVGIKLANASGCAPANQKAYEDESVRNDEMVMMMKQIADSAKSMPNRPEMDVMWTVLGNLLVSINLNNGDIDEECNKWQAKAEQLFEAMK